MLEEPPGKLGTDGALLARCPWLSQYRLDVFKALGELLRRRTVAGVFVFDIRGNRVTLRREEAQHRFDGRVAFTERHIGTVVLLPVLEVQIGDLAMVRADEGH
jgi:hypothetical protein